MSTQFEAGRYRVLVVGQSFIKSSLKQTPGFSLSFRALCNLDQPEAPVKTYQRDLVWWISDKTVGRILHDLHELGYKGQDLKGVHPKTEGFHDFRGLELELMCEHEVSGKGETFERWSLQSGTAKMDDPAELDYFDHLLNPPPKRVNNRLEIVEQGITDSDVPF